MKLLTESVNISRKSSVNRDQARRTTRPDGPCSERWKLAVQTRGWNWGATLKEGPRRQSNTGAETRDRTRHPRTFRPARSPPRSLGCGRRVLPSLPGAVCSAPAGPGPGPAARPCSVPARRRLGRSHAREDRGRAALAAGRGTPPVRKVLSAGRPGPPHPPAGSGADSARNDPRVSRGSAGWRRRERRTRGPQGAATRSLPGAEDVGPAARLHPCAPGSGPRGAPGAGARASGTPPGRRGAERAWTRAAWGTRGTCGDSGCGDPPPPRRGRTGPTDGAPEARAGSLPPRAGTVRGLRPAPSRRSRTPRSRAGGAGGRSARGHGRSPTHRSASFSCRSTRKVVNHLVARSVVKRLPWAQVLTAGSSVGAPRGRPLRGVCAPRAHAAPSHTCFKTSP